jgi:PAS domain S-box-containing protein
MEMEMMEAILTSMVDGVIVTNRRNHIVHINPAAQKIFGVGAEDILGLPINQACSRGDFCALAEQVQELSTDAVRVLELSIGNKDLKISISPLLDEGGFYSGLVMSIRDVTLEGEVNRMKTAFISTMSHELKTPLTSMKGSLQVILNKGKWLTGTEREMLGVCLRNTDRLIRMINSILEISRIESGNVEFTMKPIPVNELLIYAIEEQKGFALSRNISLVNGAGTDLPMVLGVRDRLIQVLTNLISNAVKFSPAGTVVMISAQQTGSVVGISVADHGRSISSADRSKLFTKFQQFATNEESGVGGTGLGLAICKEIVEKHGGQISYQPGLTGGNVFSFTVPIFEENNGQEQDSHR